MQVNNTLLPKLMRSTSVLRGTPSPRTTARLRRWSPPTERWRSSEGGTCQYCLLHSSQPQKITLQALDLLTASGKFPQHFVANTSQNLHCMPAAPLSSPLMCMTPLGLHWETTIKPTVQLSSSKPALGNLLC